MASGSSPTPSVFVGRGDVIGAVVRALAEPEGRGIVLHGPRRIGKTAILQHLVLALPELHTPGPAGHQPVYFDLQDRGRQLLDEVLADLAVVMAYAVGLPEPTPGPDVDGWMRDEWLPAVLRAIAPGTSLVLLIDELDVVAEPTPLRAASTFYPYLRRLLAEHAPRLRVVLALGRDGDDLERVAKPHFEGLTSCQVSLLPRADAEALIRGPGWPAWSDEAIEAAWALTHGHPFFLAPLCAHVRAHVPADRVVTPADVNAATEPIASRSRSAFEWMWRGIPPAARAVASVLATAGADGITQDEIHAALRAAGASVIVPALRDAPEKLVAWDMAEAPSPGRYRFRVELLRRLVSRYKPPANVHEDLDHLDPAADELVRAGEAAQQSGSLGSAKARFQQALGQNPNHSRAAELLADVHIARKDWASARAVLDRLHERRPAAARARLVQVLIAQAEAAQAEGAQLELYERVQQIDPRNPEARSAIERITAARAERARVHTRPTATMPAVSQPPRPTQRPGASDDATAALSRALDAAEDARVAAEAKVTALTAERDRLLQRLRAAEQPQVVIGPDPAALARTLEAERRAHNATELRLGAATSERDALLARASAVEAEYERLEGAHQTMMLERDQLAAELEALAPRRSRTSVAQGERPPASPVAVEAPREEPAALEATAAAPRSRAERWTAYAALALTLTGLSAIAVAYALQTKAIEIGSGPITLRDRGETQKVVASRVLRVGARRPAADVAWSSADPRVATVDAQGRITPAGSGTTRIEARASGFASSVEVTVRVPSRITARPAEITLAPGDEEITLEAAVLDGTGAPWTKSAEIRWSSSDPAVATIAGGKVRRAGIGEAVIEARFGDLAARVAVTSLDHRGGLAKGCDAGRLDACADLGSMMSKGEEGPADTAGALALFEKACAGGSPKGCVELGGFHEAGKGGSADAPKALAAYQKACDAKDPAGCSRLGTLYENGARGVVRDTARARDLHRAACDAGDADGCWHLGAMYELGNGVGRDAPVAEGLYKKACDGGRQPACSSLANIYWNGSGTVAKDVPAGIALYEKACDAKLEEACTTLALKYKSGEGVPADRPKSQAFFWKACQAGSKPACAVAPRAPAP